MSAETPPQGVRPCDDCIRTVEHEEEPLPNSKDDHQAGYRYRLWQAQHLLHMFYESRGHLPEAVDGPS